MGPASGGTTALVSRILAGSCGPTELARKSSSALHKASQRPHVAFAMQPFGSGGADSEGIRRRVVAHEAVARADRTVCWYDERLAVTRSDHRTDRAGLALVKTIGIWAAYTRSDQIVVGEGRLRRGA